MDELDLQLFELSQKGYPCSQILLLLALGLQGKENPDLIRAMSGLARGSAPGEGTCGTLTGACCLLGLYAGRGSDDELEDESLLTMLGEIWDWFEAGYGTQFSGISCQAILADGADMRTRCGPLVKETYLKALEILVTHGFDPRDGRT
jgi:hypothetical protein